MNELTTFGTGNGAGLVAVDPAAVAAAEAARARIQAAYTMALHKPRNTDQARDRILHACKRPGFAERVEYTKPVGTARIKGPSIRFAELALREWGNVLTESQTVYEDEYVRRIKVFVTDLETNTTFSKEAQIAKTVERHNDKDREVLGERTNTQGKKVFIVKATDDELVNKEGAQISKILRNEGLRLIPQDIIDEGLDTARDTLRNRDAQDPDAAKKKLLDGFSAIGVKPLDIEKFLKHKTGAVTPAEMEELRTMYRAIRDGEAKWADYLDEDKPAGDDPKKPDPEKLAQFAQFVKSIDPVHVEAFIKEIAASENMTPDEVKIQALDEINEFIAALTEWITKNRKSPTPPRGGGKSSGKSKAKTEAAPVRQESQAGIGNEPEPAWPGENPDDNRPLSDEYRSNIVRLMEDLGVTEEALNESLMTDGLPRFADMPHSFYEDLIVKVKELGELAQGPDFGGIERHRNQGDEHTVSADQLRGLDKHLKENGILTSELMRYLDRTHGVRRQLDIQYGWLPDIIAWARANKKNA
jgi:hypothetical protein